ncbi:hypothetical protein [Nocardia terpenica]|uniref:Uncharacterized protein n=2 Tax=Nocardia terpenica TaxID=455432 RepID=A0A809QUY6_9NOCA|nr:hypothetical protein [Nocardia terpenica]NQE85861.1 hypothetical protein [Nocardia terpenica]BBE00878.1 hypothetical protein [Nocardia terpenica]
MESTSRRPELFEYPYPRSLVLPEIQDKDHAWARANPETWMYYVDPKVDKSALQHANVMGGRLADDKGGFADYWLNPEFVPTPEYAGVELTTEFEQVLWRTNSGFNNIGNLIEAFSRSRLTVVLPVDDPEGLRGWPLRREGDSWWLDVYTSAGKLPRDVNPWLRREVSGTDVLEQVCPVEQTKVNINPDSEPGVTLFGEDLAHWWAEWREAERRYRAEQSGEQ